MLELTLRTLFPTITFLISISLFVSYSAFFFFLMQWKTGKEQSVLTKGHQVIVVLYLLGPQLMVIVCWEPSRFVFCLFQSQIQVMSVLTHHHRLTSGSKLKINWLVSSRIILSIVSEFNFVSNNICLCVSLCKLL
jgi:hypothetical protein